MIHGVKEYNVNDFVKDKFTQDDIKYLPIKYDDTYEKITRADIEKEFAARGIKIESISSEKIVNGTQIKTSNATYIVLIYGDANADGEVDIFDARQIVEWLLYEKEKSIPEITRVAANVNKENEDVIDIFDARRIVEFVLGTKPIIDTMPESDILKDKEAPVIILNGDKEVSVKVFEEYKDLGATVKDNLDETVENKVVVDTSKVNTKVPGDYEVTYNAVDASGNKSETVKRIVHVEDYVKDIEISEFPNFEYAVGQEITIDNMVAYEILAYGGKNTKPINIEDIEYTPTKATEDMIGQSEITIKYKGVTKKIPIKVIERVPIITLTGHKGSTDVKIRLGEDYEEGATAFDELDQKQLKVTIDGTVDKNTEGTYTITYTTEPNSLGKVGKVIRTVRVCDYVTDVDFEVDDTKFKTDYIEGQEISLDGVSAILTKKSGKTEKVTEGLSCTSNTTYDRQVGSKNNKDREIEIIYTAIDPVDGTSKVYKSTDKLSDVRINIKKQLETVNPIEDTIVRSGELYSDILIATVTEGADEDAISTDKLDISITPASTHTHEGGTICKAEAWAVKSATEEGALDIYCRGIENNTKYTITLTPKSNSTHKQSTTLEYTTTESQEINLMEVGSVKKSNGNKLEEFRVDGKTVSGFKVGDTIDDTIDIELNFYHNYKYNNQDHKVLLSNISKEIETSVIDKSSKETVPGINTEIVRKEGKIILRVTATDDVPLVAGAREGKEIIISASIENEAPSPATLETYVFAKSQYTVNLNEESKEDITLSLENINSAGGYEMSYIDGDVYTVLPVSIMDQYENEKDLKLNEISTDQQDINKGRLVFYDEISTTPGRNYIKTMALKTKKEKAEDGDKIRFIGIAIRDLSDILNEEDELEKQGRSIKVFFEGKLVREYKPIKIVRKAVSNLEYTADTNSNPSAGITDCYDDIEIGKVKSGARQEALTNEDLKRIGVIVRYKDTDKESPTYGEYVEEKLRNPNGAPDGFPNQTTATSKNKNFGIKEEFDNGNVTISFWAKDEGKGDNRYFVTPYIVIGSGSSRKEVVMAEKDGKYVTVTEKTTVNKVTFTDEKGNELGEGDFGTVNYGPGIRKSLTVNFYHNYEKAVEKSGKVDYRPISVKRVSVRAPKATNADNQIEKIQIASNDGVDIYTDDIANNSGLDAGIKDDNVTKIRVILKDPATSSQDAVKFSVIVDNEEIVNDKVEIVPKEFEFKGTVGKRLEVSSVDLGTDTQKESGIKIYTKQSSELQDEMENKKVIQGDDGVYYTLIPITFKASNEIEPMGSVIEAASIDKALKSSTIYYEDNLKSSAFGTVIQAVGVDQNGNIVEGTKKIHYIGIGVMSDYHEYVFGNNTSLGDTKLKNCSITCKFDYTDEQGQPGNFNHTFKFDIDSDYND